ncbi:DNA ligase 1-like [Helianthus annuus]|uniref:DNA ligase 1-like n=1 Tax=Helianthus annuus TaxID=4232 RepID=UPI000B9052DA|nr:DNA ligase 1-like [Helianthus annuus]
MYPRFVQMLINDQYKDAQNDGNLYKFHIPTSRQFTEIKTNEWVLLHDWMYRAERLPLVKEAYRKYKEAVREKQQRAAQAQAEAAAKEERSKGKRKEKQAAEDEPPKKKKAPESTERFMGTSIRAAESEEHRQHVRDMREIHALQEKEKREKKLKQKEMSASERPETVAEEVQSLNDFVDTLIVDPDEISASKGSSKVSPVKPTSISKPPVPPQRVRPFQELYDKLIKDTGPSVAKEICLLKNQVNDTNFLREKIKDQRKKNKEMNAYMAKQSKFIRFQQAGLEKMYRMMRNMCEQMKVKPMFSFEEIFDFEAFMEEETTRKEKEAEAKKKRLESVEKVTEGNESDEEEVDRDDMPARFIEWGLEEEVL